MPASEARIAAARANGLKSKGPVTAEGKARSSRNSYKHGMAGQGIVLPPDDSAEVQRRAGAMLVEMRPKTEMGRFLVRRLAELTVRVERCADGQRAANAHRAAHAGPAFDEARLAEVDHAMGWIATEPATHTRKLRSMPEGCDRLVAALLDLRDDLERGRWERYDHGGRASHLFGYHLMDVPVTRPRALSEAICGEFQHLLPGDGEGLTTAGRIDWARRAMADLIDAEVQSLLDHRETLDLEAIEVDRATAADRSAFDPSKEGILARRYEAAAERGVYKALRELERVEAEGGPAGTASPEQEAEEAEPLGSSRAEAAEESGPPRVPVPSASPTGRPAPRTTVGRPVGAPGPVDPARRGPA